MKRTVFLALALFALMAVGLYAQTEADFTVRKTSDGKSIQINGYKGSAKEISIPAKIQNLTVTEVYLDNNKNITKVTLPNGVTDFQFADFSSLISVNIPNSVTEFKGAEFGGCTSLATVTIPDSVTLIGQKVFEDCAKLTSITIPASVTRIGKDAFKGCASLTSVTFSGTLSSSGFDANAFNGLGDIRDKYSAAGGGAGTYTRPANGTTWTKSASAAATPAAAGTAGLEFTLSRDGKEYSVAKGTVTTGAVVIPASYNNLPVTEIAKNAFNGTQITAVTIPDSVKTISGYAFLDCASLTSVTIGKGVTYIDAYAFRGCAKLTSVTFSGQYPATFYESAFVGQGDIRDKYKAGGEGTYTRPSGGKHGRKSKNKVTVI